MFCRQSTITSYTNGISLDYNLLTTTRPLLDMSQGVPGGPPTSLQLSALGKAASSPQIFGYLRWDESLLSALVEEMKGVYEALPFFAMRTYTTIQ
ncbi:hypothetical protein BDQ17DRAFT_1437734 [Cyathus striatus]|nr:hypothetical protein BDQ17DRAFT_1437734 [Cyathus striatus]